MSYKSNKSYTSLNSLKSVDGRRSTKNANKKMNARLAKKIAPQFT